MEAASKSHTNKVMNKRRIISTNLPKNKLQKCQDSITNLLQLSESEEEKGNCRFFSVMGHFAKVNHCKVSRVSSYKIIIYTCTRDSAKWNVSILYLIVFCL